MKMTLEYLDFGRELLIYRPFKNACDAFVIELTLLEKLFGAGAQPLILDRSPASTSTTRRESANNPEFPTRTFLC